MKKKANPPSRRDTTVPVGMTKEQYAQAKELAGNKSWIPAWIRVLIKKAISGEVVVTREEIKEERRPAAGRGRRPSEKKGE